MKNFLIFFFSAFLLPYVTFADCDEVIYESANHVLSKCTQENIIRYNHYNNSYEYYIHDFDFDSLEIIEEDYYALYYKDKNHVYVSEYMLKDSDPETFEILKGVQTVNTYSKDKNTVYIHDRIIEDADPETFEVIKEFSSDNFEYYYGKDKNHVYLDGKILKNADPKTFQFIRKEDYDMIYTKDNKNVFLNDTPIQNAHPETFIIFPNTHYAKDKNFAYYFNTQIDGIDGKTFEYLGLGYAKDHNTIVYQGKPIINDQIDVTTFTIITPETSEYIDYPMIGNPIYGKDKNSVYIKINDEGLFSKVSEIDVSSAKVFHPFFLKDKNNVFYFEKKLERSDPSSFQVIKDEFALWDPSQSYLYAKDKNQVYFSGNIINEAESQSFEHLSLWYARDAQNIYFKNRKLPDVDRDTFVVLEHNNASLFYTKDKNHVYHNNEIFAGMDPHTFEVLAIYRACGGCKEIDYVKDKNGVYFNNIKIEEADPISFQIYDHDERLLIDKNNIYEYGEIVKDTSTIENIEKIKELQKKMKKEGDSMIFSDVLFPLYEKVLWAYQKDLIHGYNDRTFRPNNAISRAEFLKILLLSQYSKEEIEKNIQSLPNKFSDVLPNDWSFSYIHFAAEKNIIGGYNDNTFKPNQYITFGEASKILVETLIPESKNNYDNTLPWDEGYTQLLNSELRKKGIYILHSLKNWTSRGEMVEYLYWLQH